MITDDQLSPALKEFILLHHHRPHTEDVLSMWSYNLRGYHVFHTAVRKAQDKELIAAGGLATYEQLIELFLRAECLLRFQQNKKQAEQ